ncbi:MAG: 3'-5' exoribonuclease domain-containing protein, partial [Waterburya sp.]
MSDQKLHMMLDIETLGTKSSCEIIQIGAVIFNSKRPLVELENNFFQQ